MPPWGPSALPTLSIVTPLYPFYCIVLKLCVPVILSPSCTFESVGDDSITLFTFCHSSIDAAINILSVRAYDWTRSPSSSASSIRVQRRVGRGQETGWVWVSCSRAVDVAVPSEAVRVWLAWRSVPPSLLHCLWCHLITGTTEEGAAVGRRQKLPLYQHWTEGF